MKKIIKIKNEVDQKIVNGLRMPRTIRRNICRSVGLRWEDYRIKEFALSALGHVALRTHDNYTDEFI